MNLSQENWAEQLENDTNAVILDVRTDGEFRMGHVPKAHKIDILKGDDYFSSEITVLDKTKNYYVYCRSGKRSTMACNIMNSMGFKNIYNLEGGFDAWQGESVTD